MSAAASVEPAGMAANDTPWKDGKAAAEYIGTTEDNLAQMRSRGAGPRYSKPSRRMVRYHVADIDAWLRDHTMVGAVASVEPAGWAPPEPLFCDNCGLPVACDPSSDRYTHALGLLGSYWSCLVASGRGDMSGARATVNGSVRWRQA